MGKKLGICRQCARAKGRVCNLGKPCIAVSIGILSGDHCMQPRRRLTSCMIALPALAIALCQVNAAETREESHRTAVPSWDARGRGPLPWQGISCIDVSDDARHIAIGTTAPPGDPNVFLLDGDGRLLRTAQAGQRWIQQVAVDHTGQLVHALSTMPEGRAGDFPTVYVCGKPALAVPPQLGENGWPQNLFHYGAHSNHIGVI